MGRPLGWMGASCWDDEGVDASDGGGCVKPLPSPRQKVHASVPSCPPNFRAI